MAMVYMMLMQLSGQVMLCNTVAEALHIPVPIITGPIKKRHDWQNSLGKMEQSYEKEAGKILAAINKNLWMSDKGWYAEYKDLLGNKLLHPSAGLWTIYHAIDSKVPDAFKAYQALRYIDKHIPHIPVIAKGWSKGTRAFGGREKFIPA